MNLHVIKTSGRLLLFACLIVLMGFGSSIAADPVQNDTDPAVVSISEPSTGEFVYQSRGRRDPFAPLIQRDEPAAAVVKRERRPEQLRGPLERFELRQLRLVAVMVVQGVPRAMVSAPDGKSYTVKVDDYIGLDGGRVKDIQTRLLGVDESGMRIEQHPDRIIVEEIGVDSVTGRTIKEERFIVL